MAWSTSTTTSPAPASVVAGRQALSHRLVKVALEEVAHFVTGATDNSRDFQDFLLDLAVKLGRGRAESREATATA